MIHWNGTIYLTLLEDTIIEKQERYFTNICVLC